jgi:hypothetical protein
VTLPSTVYREPYLDSPARYFCRRCLDFYDIEGYPADGACPIHADVKLVDSADPGFQRPERRDPYGWLALIPLVVLLAATAGLYSGNVALWFGGYLVGAFVAAMIPASAPLVDPAEPRLPRRLRKALALAQATQPADAAADNRLVASK